MREKLHLSSRPSGMRILLIAASVIVILLTATVASLARNYLTDYATTVAQTTAASQDTQKSLDSLTRAKKELDQQKDTVEKAKRIVAESKEYYYQNQIINDLSAYADQTNMKIGSFTFETPGNGGAAAPAAPAAPAPGAPAAPATGGGAIAGLKTAQVTISLADTINYTDFLNFLSLVENNATRMQIQGVDISPAATADSRTPGGAASSADMVSVRSLTIGVYIR